MLRNSRIAQSKFRPELEIEFRFWSSSGRNSKTHSGTSILNCILNVYIKNKKGPCVSKPQGENIKANVTFVRVEEEARQLGFSS